MCQLRRLPTILARIKIETVIGILANDFKIARISLLKFGERQSFRRIDIWCSGYIGNSDGLRRFTETTV